LLSVASDRFL